MQVIHGISNNHFRCPLDFGRWALQQSEEHPQIWKSDPKTPEDPGEELAHSLYPSLSRRDNRGHLLARIYFELYFVKIEVADVAKPGWGGSTA